MFEKNTKLIEALKNPLSISSMALDELQARLGGDKIVADPNTPFCFLLEFASSINCASLDVMDQKLEILYPQRARSMDDLYHHMSDFDYLRLYSSPSQTQLRLMLPKKYLIDNALPYNENYKQLTLPKDTVFLLGKYPFGIYFPINILINNYTNTFTVVYDTNYKTPLFTLTKNVVDKYDYTYRGIDYLIIDFPIYQFAKSITTETLVAATGFAKKYLYNNKFYAVRLFNYKDGVYTELSQSQSKIVYDPTNPTALIRVLPDEQKIYITIPQIYFDEGIMGSQLYIEMYTTLGALDIDTTKISGGTIQANFGLKSKDTTDYSAIFKNLPFDSIIQLNSRKISGGSDAIDVETLRDRVVNDTLYEKAPITEEEVAVYLNDNSFYLKKYRDNVTERIYHAYRVLEDGNGAIIPSVTVPMEVQTNYPRTHSGFKLQSDNSITVLPTTIYKYIEEVDDVAPLTDEEMIAVSTLDKQGLADLLNNDMYFKSPFHVRMDLENSYPEARSYNLMVPKVEKLIFVEENFNVATKMMAVTGVIAHLDNGVGGYDVQVAVYKSDDLKDISEEFIKVYVATKTTDGYWIGTTATHMQDIDSRSIYTFPIRTNYHLTTKDEIYITNFQSESVTLQEHSIKLESDFYLVFMVLAGAALGSADTSPSRITTGVPENELNGYVALARQYMTIHLGHSLTDVIKNDLEISSAAKTYEVWDHNVVATWDEDQYERNPDGTLAYVEDDEGNLVLNKLHEVGDPKYDENGLPVYLHREGEVRRDASGNPIVAIQRDKIFYIDMLLIDAKVFASERTAELQFVSNLYQTLEGYFDIIRNLQDQLLERTYTYFRCVRSTGTAKFNLGDGVISKQNIEMSFRLICYVPSYVKKDDNIQSEIRTKTCEAIEEAIKTKTISMMDIFTSVKAKMSDYIDHFTLLGINNDVSTQTFEVVSEDAQPSVARKLVLTDDNILSLVKQVDIEFVALDDNTINTATYAV